MAIDFTGVTKIIKLETNNAPETQTKIKRVYLGGDLQWQKPQSPYIWQLVTSTMSEPWALNDLVVLVKFTRQNSSQTMYYRQDTTYNNNRFCFLRSYPYDSPIPALNETINGDITLYYDQTLGWCLTDDILPTQVNIVTKTSGKYAQLKNNYSYLGTPNPNTTQAGYYHYLHYHPDNDTFWWYPSTPYNISDNTLFKTVYGVGGTTTAPNASGQKWWMAGSGNVQGNIVWIPASTQPSEGDANAQWGFFKRVRNANNQ